MDLSHLLIALVLIYAGAKTLGELAGRIGQPPVLGELVAGVVLGVGALKVVDPNADVLVLLADIGVIILLFETGLATDFKELLAVGWRSVLVAVVGIVAPFILGFLFAHGFGYPMLTAVFLGAALTATSIGITVRVLSDLGKMGTREAKIILGAAVADDIIGLIILAVVRDLAASGTVHPMKVISVTLTAVAFFTGALVVGNLFAPRLVRVVEKMRCAGTLIVAAVAFAFFWAFAAEVVGSATIVGAFAAGVALGRTHKYEVIAQELKPVAYIFTPLFFVMTGAGVDVRVFNPFNPANHTILVIAGALFVAAVVGKLASGVGGIGGRVNGAVIGIGMSPRGEVGLIFADVGRRAGVVEGELFAALVAVMAMTTFFAPPFLKFTLTPPKFRSKRLRDFFFKPLPKERRRLLWWRRSCKKDDDGAR